MQVTPYTMREQVRGGDGNDPSMYRNAFLLMDG